MMLSQRNVPRALRNHDGLADPVEPIRKNHDIGRFGRGTRAASTHGNANIGRRQRRRVIDAVPDHDGRIETLLSAHRVDLVGRNAIRQHAIQVERGSDGLRGSRAIAGDHADARYTRRTQHANRLRRIGAQFIGEQEGANRPFIDGDENHQGRTPRAAAQGPYGPCIGVPMSKDHVVGPSTYAPALDNPMQAGTRRTLGPVRA